MPGFYSNSSNESNSSYPAICSSSSSRRSDVHQNLLITLACSELSDVSINERIYPAIGAPLGTGAAFSVERKEAKGEKLVAVKHVLKRDDRPNDNSTPVPDSKAILDAVLLELRVLLHLNSLQHRNVVRLLAYGWDEGPLPYLVLEYADLGSLRQFLQASPQSWEEKHRTVVGLASALEMLHACEVIHGDIKLENILVFSSRKRGFDAKLADFGLSCSTALGRKEYHGTKLVNAPEIRTGRRGGVPFGDIIAYEKADVYSYGLAVWEILNDGGRYYHSPSIGIAASEYEFVEAERFLAELDLKKGEITCQAADFIRSLEIPPEMRDQMDTALKLALVRDPEERCDIREFRLVLDSSEESEPEIANPLLTPCYSIFDITASPLPWGTRRELKEGFEGGSTDDANEFQGQDAFNNAALLATGFGCEIDCLLSFKELRLSSSLGYLPATVLCSIFAANGLMSKPPRDPINVDHCRFLDSMGSELRLVSQEKKFASQFRGFYRFQNAMLAQLPITVSLGGNLVVLENQTNLEKLLQGHSNADIDDATVSIGFEDRTHTKPLMHHLILSHEKLAESLLEGGCDASRRTQDLMSLLLVACAAGSSTLVRLLLTKCPEYATRATREGISPLHWLFMFGEDEIEDIARDLVKPGADLMRVGVGSFPEFNLVISGSPLHWAVAARNMRAIEILINLGANVNAEVPRPMVECLECCPNPLDFAVSLVMPEVVALLIRLGARSNDRRKSDGKVPLHHIGDCTDPFRLWMYHGSSIEGAVMGTVQVLLDSGANLDGHDDDEDPLYVVATSPSDSILVLAPFLGFKPAPSRHSLLRALASTLQHDHVGSQKMTLMCKYYIQNLGHDKFMEECMAAIRVCAEDGTIAAGQVLLSHLPKDAGSIIDQEELLHLAAQTDQSEMIELLLDRGANIDHDTDGSPAAAAANFCKRRALGVLLRREASLFSQPSTQSQMTLLHEITSGASSRLESELALELIKDDFCDRFNRVVDNYDDRGLTALHQAVFWGSIANVENLLHLGATDCPVRGTTVTTTSVARQAQEKPPWLIVQQGTRRVEQYKADLNTIFEYLVSSSVGFRVPAETCPSERDVSLCWTQPAESEWRETDMLGEWYNPRRYDDTGRNSDSDI